MDKKIIYSFKEFQEKYIGLLDEYYLEYEECEEIDFIENEIQKYNIYSQIVNLPIDQAFNRWFRIETSSNLKTFSISEKTFNFIFENENEQYYYKIYNDFDVITGGVEKKVRHARIIFPKIINYLETKKSELEANQQEGPTYERERVPVIALLHYYNEQYISRDNAQSIANKYGYNAKTSGEGLYQDFVYYAENTNRKASGENRIKCNNRIKNQNRVIELLIDENAKSKAITELDLLKNKLENLS